MNLVYTFGLLKIRKSYSKVAYRLSDRTLMLTSTITLITANSHSYNYVPITQFQNQFFYNFKLNANVYISLVENMNIKIFFK